MTETFVSAPPTRCKTCGVFPEVDQPSCAGCGKRRPTCGCRKGWSQSQHALQLGNPLVWCPHCTLLH